MQIVDTATIIYQTKYLKITEVIKRIQHLTKTNVETENNKYIFRNIHLEEYEFLNFISVTELRRNIRIAISFSYSRFESKGDNYAVCTRQRTITDVHAQILKLFKFFTDKPLKYSDLEVYTIDISNQLSVENIRSYYSVLDLIYRAMKLNEPNGRLYFDIDDKKRKQLDGLDFRERGKKRREASSYFKVYSKRKEAEDTGKLTAGRTNALRGELTLKGLQLKKWQLATLAGINKENLERVLRETLAETIITGINKELEFSVKHLTTILSRDKTKRIRENILINDFHVFDLKILDIILTPEILGVTLRQCQTHKKQIIELIEKNSTNGEIKKTYVGNFERLKKLLKKIAKIDIIVNIEKTGVNIEWEKLK